VNSHIAQTVERGPWRRFFWALGGLALALFLALYATGLCLEGRYAPAAAAAAIALLLAGVIAAYAVPYLARRTALRSWMVRIDYEFTREGAVYLLLVVAIIIAALNTGNNLLFIILACLLAGIVASGILSRGGARPIPRRTRASRRPSGSPLRSPGTSRA
jgi:quinol-cytochrome oxidoreductase complex cytochrome b subunit